MKSTVEPQAVAAFDLQPLVTATRGVSTSKISWTWHLLHCGPFFLLVWFVSRFGVNVPVLDEWAWAYWFQAVRFKRAGFEDFFALANEHRFVFPKLIWTPLAFATHWNLRVEMLLNLVPALIVFIVFYLLALRQAKQTDNTLFHLANFSTSFFLFSLVQYQTWLWGITGSFLFAQAAVALAIGICFTEKLHAWTRFCLAAFFCFIASFSVAQGVGSWLALLPCIALLQTGRRKNLKFYIWFLLFAASGALYSYHFKFLILREENRPFDFLYHPLQSAGFFIALLGAPFSQSDPSTFVIMACLMGGVILLALLVCLVMLRDYPRKELLAPWLSVALFGLIFAAMVVVGRSAQGLVAANQSRYITATILVAIAVIQLGRLVSARQGAKTYLLFLGALWALMISGSIMSLSTARLMKQDLSHAKLFVELLRYMDPAPDSAPESPTSPLYTGSEFRAPAELLNQIGFLHLASDVAFVEHSSPEYGLFEFADGSGDLLHLRRDKDELTVSGWASLPAGRGLPKVVLISFADRKTFITGAVVGWVNRPDIAALRRDPRYFHSGWKVSFPAKFLPPGEGVLKAWVYDSAEKKFLRLPESGGEKQFNVEAR